MYIDDISPSFKQELQRRHMEFNPEQDHKYLFFPHRLKNGEIRTVDIYSSPIQFRGKRSVIRSFLTSQTGKSIEKNCTKKMSC
jgi:hypothetical protein